MAHHNVDKLALDIAEYMNGVDGRQTLSRFLATGEVLRMVAKIRENERREGNVVELAVAAEREACAKIADAMTHGSSGPHTCEMIAAAIRARGEGK